MSLYTNCTPQYVRSHLVLASEAGAWSPISHLHIICKFDIYKVFIPIMSFNINIATSFWFWRPSVTYDTYNSRFSSQFKIFNIFKLYISLFSITSCSCFWSRSVITNFSPLCHMQLSLYTTFTSHNFLLYTNLISPNFRSQLFLASEAGAWSPRSQLHVIYRFWYIYIFHPDNVEIYKFYTSNWPITSCSCFWSRSVISNFSHSCRIQNP